ncbi:MAG: hypothetical protein GY862_06365 [Gammaproteobacteria bacterium]|nr:hypothetical protein [Gammaproteobacteria bacterium]
MAAVITDNTPYQKHAEKGCYPFRLFTDFIGVPYKTLRLAKTFKRQLQYLAQGGQNAVR